MTPTTYPDLLKSLRGLEKHLAAAYARTARADDRVRAQVTARWTAAEVGGRLDDYIDPLCPSRWRRCERPPPRDARGGRPVARSTPSLSAAEHPYSISFTNRPRSPRSCPSR